VLPKGKREFSRNLTKKNRAMVLNLKIGKISGKEYFLDVRGLL
jgi:hypothetical protein